MMAEWWSIEVLHGEQSAFRWQEQHDSERRSRPEEAAQAEAGAERQRDDAARA